MDHFLRGSNSDNDIYFQIERWPAYIYSAQLVCPHVGQTHSSGIRGDDDDFEEHELEYEYDEAARRRIGNERRKTTGVVRKAGTGFDEVGGAEFIEAMRELKLPALKPPPNLLPRENLRAPILYEHAPQNRRTFTPWHETELGALMETRPFQEPHPDWETRLKAVKSLDELNNPIVIPSLVDRSLQDVSIRVRWRSIESLKRHDSYRSEIVALLLSGLEDSDSEIVKNAAVALALYGNEEAKDDLIVMLQDEADVRRREAVFALGEIRTDDIISHLYPLLDQNIESNEVIREEVVKVIGRIGNSQSIPYLLGVLRLDVDEGVRVHSAIALGNLGDATIVGKLEELYRNEQSAIVLPHIKASLNRLN